MFGTLSFLSASLFYDVVVPVVFPLFNLLPLFLFEVWLSAYTHNNKKEIIKRESLYYAHHLSGPGVGVCASSNHLNGYGLWKNGIIFGDGVAYALHTFCKFIYFTSCQTFIILACSSAVVYCAAYTLYVLYLNVCDEIDDQYYSWSECFVCFVLLVSFNSIQSALPVYLFAYESACNIFFSSPPPSTFFSFSYYSFLRALSKSYKIFTLLFESSFILLACMCVCLPPSRGIHQKGY